MKISKFAARMTKTSGIARLMQDLAEALAQEDEMLMLGGGNPAHIPLIQKHLRQRITRLLNEPGEFESIIGNYASPQGSTEFISALADLLAENCGWNIGPENIALTNGSQSAFFILFNTFAGKFDNGTTKKVLFPLTPEYIGYSDVGLTDDLFVANRPRIEHIDDHKFKYHIDFDQLNITDDIGAICVSRPTNPSGNVLTDTEIKRLSEIAHINNIPLIIDSAYGIPFPGIVFTEANPFWNEHTILCMSLSKFGLPAARTGIVIANPETITMVTQMNAVMCLTPGSIGAAIAADLVSSGDIIHLSRDVVRPFYQARATKAAEVLSNELDGVNFHLHAPEGAFFLWLWLPDLPISCSDLYQLLKARGVLVVPGYYFFPGLKEPWTHTDQCIRINYSQEESAVMTGLRIIGQEIQRVSACG